MIDNEKERSETMRILALDSSGLVASVAVVEEEQTIAEYTVNYKKTHSQTLLPMLDEIVKMTEMNLGEIDAIAVAGGPGSFTGLRIGSATAKGLGLALKKPLIHIPTVDGLAYNLYGNEGVICPIMDARRNQVYTGIYRFREEFVVEEPQMAIEISALAEKLNERGEQVTFLGDGVPVYKEQLEQLLHVPVRFAPSHMNRQRAAAVGTLAVQYWKEGKIERAEDHQPDYLRMSQAERERLEREEKESDIMPLYALEEQCFCPSDRWSMADIRKAYELEHFFVLVAEEAEEICGYCIVYAVMDSADIGKIAVAPKARGKGIAGNLLEHLWKFCAERGIKDVILEVRASNDAARCLYTKYGFETISLRKDYYKEPMEHGLTMQKNLSE